MAKKQETLTEVVQRMTQDETVARLTEKRQHIKAGEVIYTEYMGDNKPCNKALALLLTPITVEEGKDIGEFSTAYMLDVETGDFAPECKINGVTARISRVPSGKLKAAYFEKITEICKRNRTKE